MVVDTEPALTTEDRAEATEWGEGDVAHVVVNLGDRQQELLRQRYIHDLNLRTIGELSVTTEAAVSQRLATCHRILE